jgi:hypothetical protein
MAVSTAMSIFFFFLFLFQCSPVSYFWTQLQGQHGHCINHAIISRNAYFYSSISCWSDWTFCILPAFMVWKLQMNHRTKVSVLILFALGAVYVSHLLTCSDSPVSCMQLLFPPANVIRASTTTIVRIPYLDTLQDKADFLYATSKVGILSTCEIGIGITASAGATLRPLFRRFLGRSEAGSSGMELSHPWPRCSARAGYVREREGITGFADIEHIAVTTVTTVESRHGHGHENNMSGAGIVPPVEYVRTHVSKTWHTSKLEDASSEEYKLGENSRPR